MGKDVRSTSYLADNLYGHTSGFPGSGGTGTAPRSVRRFRSKCKGSVLPFNIYNKVIDSAILDANAAWLKQNPDAKMWIRYADPRGDIVYNLVLLRTSAPNGESAAGKAWRGRVTHRLCNRLGQALPDSSAGG
jgi:hypothetical protein